MALSMLDLCAENLFLSLEKESDKRTFIDTYVRRLEKGGVNWEHLCGRLAMKIGADWKAGTEWEEVLSRLEQGAEKTFPACASREELEEEITSLKKKLKEEKTANVALAEQLRKYSFSDHTMKKQVEQCQAYIRIMEGRFYVAQKLFNAIGAQLNSFFSTQEKKLKALEEENRLLRDQLSSKVVKMIDVFNASGQK